MGEAQLNPMCINDFGSPILPKMKYLPNLWVTMHPNHCQKWFKPAAKAVHAVDPYWDL